MDWCRSLSDGVKRERDAEQEEAFEQAEQEARGSGTGARASTDPAPSNLEDDAPMLGLIVADWASDPGELDLVDVVGPPWYDEYTGAELDSAAVDTGMQK